MKAPPPFQIGASGRKTARGRGSVRLHSSEDDTHGPLGVIPRLDRQLEPVRRVLAKGHALVRLQLVAAPTDLRFREADVECPFVIEVRHLALANPKGETGTEHPFTDGDALHPITAPFKKRLLPTRHENSLVRQRPSRHYHHHPATWSGARARERP